MRFVYARIVVAWHFGISIGCFGIAKLMRATANGRLVTQKTDLYNQGTQQLAMMNVCNIKLLSRSSQMVSVTGFD